MPHVCVVPYISFCVHCLLLYQDWAKFIIILMIPEPCSTHQNCMLHNQLFSDWFHTVSFTMQSHDQNSSLYSSHRIWENHSNEGENNLNWPNLKAVCLISFVWCAVYPLDTRWEEAWTWISGIKFQYKTKCKRIMWWSLTTLGICVNTSSRCGQMLLEFMHTIYNINKWMYFFVCTIDHNIFFFVLECQNQLY